MSSALSLNPLDCMSVILWEMSEGNHMPSSAFAENALTSAIIPVINNFFMSYLILSISQIYKKKEDD